MMSCVRGCQDSVQVLSSVRGRSMTESTGHEITELLQAWREGDERALEKLTPRSIANCTTRRAAAWPGSATAIPYKLLP